MNAEQLSGNAVIDHHQVGDSSGDQFLTFLLAGEEYGVDILRVQEIKGLDGVTEIPNTPSYVLGVINLRGTVIPVVDLRLRFGMQSLEYSKLTVVIVMRVQDPETSAERTIGFVVDSVSDVYNIQRDDISPSPDFGSRVDVSFVQGLVNVDDKMVIVLDVDQLAQEDV